MKKLLNRFYYLCEILAMGSVFLIAFLIGLQIILRLFGLQIPSVIEISSFLLATSAFLALSSSFLKGKHLRITMLVNILPTRIAQFVDLTSHLLCFLLLSAISYEVILFCYESFKYEEMSDGIVGIPLWIPQSFMVFGILAMNFAVLQKFIELLAEFRKGIQ